MYYWIVCYLTINLIKKKFNYFFFTFIRHHGKFATSKLYIKLKKKANRTELTILMLVKKLILIYSRFEMQNIFLIVYFRFV